MGGDEFVFVLPGMPADRLPDKLEQVDDAVRAAAGRGTSEQWRSPDDHRAHRRIRSCSSVTELPTR